MKIIPRLASLERFRLLTKKCPVSNRNHCPVCSGFGVQFRPECCPVCFRNRCPVSAGIRKTTYADQLCGDSAAVVEVDPFTISNWQAHQREYIDQLQAIDQRVERGKISRKISKLQSRKRALRRNRDTAIARLREQITYTESNDAVLIYQNEIADARAGYASDVAEIDKVIADLKMLRERSYPEMS